MRMNIAALFCLLCGMVAQGQQLAVESMSCDPTDLSAQYCKRLDANGQLCALVKVATMAQHPQFHGNLVGKVTKHEGYYWVYMTAENPASRFLEISSDDFLPLRVKFAEYGETSLAAGCTYKIMLIDQSNKKNTEKTGQAAVALKEALAMYDKQDYTNAFKYFTDLATDGNAQAQYYLGVCYDRGLGVAKDTTQATFWYSKAEEQGYTSKQFLERESNALFNAIMPEAHRKQIEKWKLKSK